MRGGESWRVSEGKMRKIDGAAAVRARPGDESVARAYLDLVAAAKLGDHANLVALRELGQRLVHQVSHVLASPAHGTRAARTDRRAGRATRGEEEHEN